MPARPDGARSFQERLRSGPPLLLDAALGTELTRRGADTSPPLWSAGPLLSRPALVEEIHAENAAAGAEILTAGTFRTQPFTAGARAEALTRLAVELARSGARRGSRAAGLREETILVAGSMAPLADCYSPELVPDEATLSREHGAHADALASCGADLLLVETMSSAREWRAAVRAAAGTGLPVLASAVTDGAGRLLSGEELVGAARSLLDLPLPPAALGINCVPARRIAGELQRLAAALPGFPLLAYGNTGLPLDRSGERFTEPIEPRSYAALAEEWLGLGARILGGCCGTRAAHVAALRDFLRERRVGQGK